MINQEIQDYAQRSTSQENELLTELRQKTMAERADKNMLSGFYQGRLLAMLSKMCRPKSNPRNRDLYGLFRALFGRRFERKWENYHA